MAAPGHFQLFPPPPPPKTNRDSNNPFRRNGMSRLSTVPTTTSTIIEDVSNESPEVQRSADGVEIQVFKEISPVQEPPKVHVQPIRAASPPTKPIEAGPSTFPKRNISLSKRPTRIDTGKGRDSPVPILQEHVYPNRKSLVVAIRSVFPRYNPGVPLTKQSYYPQRVKTPENIPERAISRNEYSPSAASVSRIDEIVGGPKTAPASVLNFPTDVLDVDPAPISTIGELKTLWEAANGQGPEFATESFNLKLSRYVIIPLIDALTNVLQHGRSYIHFRLCPCCTVLHSANVLDQRTVHIPYTSTECTFHTTDLETQFRTTLF